MLGCAQNHSDCRFANFRPHWPTGSTLDGDPHLQQSTGGGRHVVIGHTRRRGVVGALRVLNLLFERLNDGFGSIGVHQGLRFSGVVTGGGCNPSPGRFVALSIPEKPHELEGFGLAIPALSTGTGG